MMNTKPVTSSYLPTYFETASGLIVDLANPHVDSIAIDDIAFGLSRLPRFCGHTKSRYGYSVATHSVWVASYIKHKTGDDRYALYGLLHDAHEAYTGDIPTPLKSVKGVRDVIEPIQQALQKTIYKAVDLPLPTLPIRKLINDADKQALAMEARYLKMSGGKGWFLPAADEIAQQVMFYPAVGDSLYQHELFIRFYWKLVEAINSRGSLH